MSPTLTHARRALHAIGAASMLYLSASAYALTFTEGFDAGVPDTWSQRNDSSPVGPSGWTQGAAALSPAQGGTTNSFVVVNFQAGNSVSTLSDWLWTPTLTVSPDSVLTFYTRTASNPATNPDRLEVRWSSAAVADPGTTATDVGSFTTLLLTVNPSLSPTAYPALWTAYSYSFSALPASVTGNLAFRYFVTNGGPSGANSNIIGLDTVSVTNVVSNVPEAGSSSLMALGLAVFGLCARRVRRA